MENKKDENNSLDLDTTIAHTSHKVEDFYNKNKNSINIIFVLVVIAIGSYFLFKMYYLEPKEKEAASAVFNAQNWFDKDSFNLALNGQGEIPGFLTIADDYGLTKVGNLSHYYAGICYMRLGKYEDAISQLKDFSTDNKMISPLADGLLGDAYVETGDIAKGAKQYIKASKTSENKLTAPIFLKKAGLAYEDIQQYSNAISAYEKIKKDYLESQEAQDIDKYIARAKSAKDNS